jgi:hypothetical protein
VSCGTATVQVRATSKAARSSQHAAPAGPGLGHAHRLRTPPESRLAAHEALAPGADCRAVKDARRESHVRRPPEVVRTLWHGCYGRGRSRSWRGPAARQYAVPRRSSAPSARHGLFPLGLQAVPVSDLSIVRGCHALDVERNRTFTFRLITNDPAVDALLPLRELRTPMRQTPLPPRSLDTAPWRPPVSSDVRP